MQQQPGTTLSAHLKIKTSGTDLSKDSDQVCQDGIVHEIHIKPFHCAPEIHAANR